MTLMAELISKAAALGVPLTAHVDLTYRCNERCEHCYLDHDDKGEMSYEEISGLLGELADAGVLFLILSGGEPMLRRDFFDIVARARALLFNVKVKTNAVLVRTAEAQRLRALGVEQMQVSVYSHEAGVHDAITRLPGSLRRTIEGIRALRAAGLKVAVANVMMRSNLADRQEVAAMARELGATYSADPTVTPMMDGDRSVLDLRIPGSELHSLFQDKELVGDPEAAALAEPPVRRVADQQAQRTAVRVAAQYLRVAAREVPPVAWLPRQALGLQVVDVRAHHGRVDPTVAQRRNRATRGESADSTAALR